MMVCIRERVGGREEERKRERERGGEKLGCWVEADTHEFQGST